MAELRAIYNVRGPAGTTGTTGGTGPGLPVAGTTGQVPKKNSVTDFDIDWATLVAADISDFDAAVRTNRLDQMATPTAAVAMGAQKLTGVLDGTAAQDAVSKTQMDTADTTAKARANHTGTQLAATVSDFDAAAVAAVAAADADSGWVNITLNAGYSERSASYTPQYRRVGNRLYLRGQIIKNFTIADVLFTLPVGYRPAREHVMLLKPDLTVISAWIASAGTFNIPAEATNNSSRFVVLTTQFLND